MKEVSFKISVQANSGIASVVEIGGRSADGIHQTGQLNVQFDGTGITGGNATFTCCADADADTGADRKSTDTQHGHSSSHVADALLQDKQTAEQRRSRWLEEDLQPLSLPDIGRRAALTTLTFIFGFVLLWAYAALFYPEYLDPRRDLPDDIVGHIETLFNLTSLKIECELAAVVLLVFALLPVLRRYMRSLHEHILTIFCSAAAFYTVFMTYAHMAGVPEAAPWWSILAVFLLLPAAGCVYAAAFALAAAAFALRIRKSVSGAA